MSREHALSCRFPETGGLSACPGVRVAAAFLAVAVLAGLAARADAQSTWIGTSDANWNTPANWDVGVPNGLDAAAILGRCRSAPEHHQPQRQRCHAGPVELPQHGRHHAGGSLQPGPSGSTTAAVNVSGTQVINTGVNLFSNATVTVTNSGDSLTLNGVTGAGSNLSFGGAGTATVNGSLNLGTGSLSMAGVGLLNLSGSGTASWPGPPSAAARWQRAAKAWEPARSRSTLELPCKSPLPILWRRACWDSITRTSAEAGRIPPTP